MPTHPETLEVRDRCLCFRAQRTARLLARRFDAAFRPFGLTNGQFSLLMSVNRPDPPSIGAVAPFLGMDRTSLTAMVKPLERRGLVTVTVDPEDRRGRLLSLTEEGRALLNAALPVWRAEHDRLDVLLRDAGADPASLRDGLGAVPPP
ncbi:MarR family winged helix-turn-helix transcriptional regulator [Jannaschia formosa]|uniref:MarR family winged helix-turn-helix transcriptional regulator n=1 Tax=Jannaschia formosa TaxID=2259592 RepID=UPI000E1BC12A|nr:MarR family transcriptional regulator [Jannaschia formosa]TFL18842.1 MarR family transcriptional regulator [Jannaschia formosa]